MRSRQICRELDAEDVATMWQRDTYFIVSAGRLKLREQAPGGVQLIHYDRADDPHQRESRYRIAPISEPETVLSVLGASLGVLVTVTKRRHVYRWQSVRIHLDDVDQLGSFIELEAVAPADSDLRYEHRLVAQLREVFDLKDELLVANGYADQMLAREGEDRIRG